MSYANVTLLNWSVIVVSAAITVRVTSFMLSAIERGSRFRHTISTVESLNRLSISARRHRRASPTNKVHAASHYPYILSPTISH